jgi:hypothetical protein
MPDYILCYTGPQDVQVEFAGKGHVAGVIISTTESTSGACSLYDYAGAGPPTGPLIYNVVLNNQYFITHLFNDRYAPRFNDGLWLHLSDKCYLILYAHFPITT